MEYVENRTLDEIEVGESAEITRELTRRDIELFAVMSGDVNPTHVDPDYAAGGQFQRIVGHGMWGGALISAVLGAKLPGPGTVYVDQRLHFRRSMVAGDVITARATVTAKDMATGEVRLACLCLDADGKTVIEGEAVVTAPREKIRRPRAVLPEVTLHTPGARFRALVERAAALETLVTAVVHPCDAASLEGALAAREAGLIEPLLVGPRAKIEAAAEGCGVSLAGLEIVEAPHSHAAAAEAVRLAREGRAEALMKGKLHTDELLAEVVRKDTGLRTDRRLSHVFALDVPSHPRMLHVTDAAINIDPDLEALADIVRNAVDLLRALGTDQPRVALLSAVETVTGRLPSTIEAAAICKMRDRGQIEAGIIDGPLAFDNAISAEAARTKGIVSAVAGQPDVLVVPNLESGNMVAKQLIYLAGADAAGIALGARVPIMLTSRSDGPGARLASAALAVLMARRRRPAAD